MSESDNETAPHGNTVWTVLGRARDRWTREDREPTVLFTYSAPTGEPTPGLRMAAELRAYADKIENRARFFALQQQLDAEGFES